jgi:hypothetical protein
VSDKKGNKVSGRGVHLTGEQRPTALPFAVAAFYCAKHREDMAALTPR